MELQESGAGSLGLGGSSSKSELEVIEQCTLSAIVAAPPLQELVGERFIIVYVYKTYFNQFLVMEKDTYQDQLFRLREEICDVVKEDLKLKEEPFLGQVVLAKHPDHDKDYHRAYVDNINFADNRNLSTTECTALVYFIDLGGHYEVNLKDLKPVTKPIMEFPILSYRVCLHTEDKDLFDDKGLIICKQFQKFMEKIQKAELIIKELPVRVAERSSDSVLDLMEIFCLIPVTIKYVFEKTAPRPLTAALDELKIWEWERTFNRLFDNDNPERVNDDTISTNGQFGNVERDISYFELTPGTTFTAEVTRISGSKTENDTGFSLRVILLDDDVHRNYHDVIHNQMKRYSSWVCKSQYSPELRNVFMFKLDRKEEYAKQGIKGLGQWCRAMKLDVNWIYLIDWDSNIPLDGVGSNDYDMRPLYAEFLQVPALTLIITPTVNGNMSVRIPFEKGKDLFTVGQRYQFKAPKESSNTGDELERLVEFPGWSGQDEEPGVVEDPSDSISTSSSGNSDDTGNLRRPTDYSTSTTTSSNSVEDEKPLVVMETKRPLFLVPSGSGSISASNSASSSEVDGGFPLFPYAFPTNTSSTTSESD